MNSVCLVGRLCADPELKETQNGLAVTSVSVAIDRMPGSEDNVTDFISCVFWRKTAEFVCRYFRKGDMIAITGAIQTRQYTDRYDNKRTAYEVVASHVGFCGNRRDNGQQETAAYAPQPAKPIPARQRGEPLPPPSDFTEDDEKVPF